MRRALVLLSLLAWSCGEPSIVDVTEPRGVIEGTVVYPNGAARGNVYLFLYGKDDPPPPVGFGRPIGFIAVARDDLFRGALAGERSTFSARFTFPNVPPGRFELRAFLDADGNFNPSHELLAQPTAGDVVGGALEPTGAFTTIVVRAGVVTANDVLVTLARELPVERPAFRHASATGFEVPLAAPSSLTLDSASFDRGLIRMNPEQSRFLVQLVGRDAEGRPLDADGDHLPDLYPRVLLRRIEVATSTRTIIVPLITNPLPFLERLLADGFAITDRLELIVPPLAVELEGAVTRRLPNVPPGDYETIVLSGTGQTWRVPNELEALFPGEPEPSQSVVVRMSAGPELPPARIRGRLIVRMAPGPAEAFVFAFPEATPPPPEGTGRPVGVAIVARSSFARSAAGLEAPFEVRGLSPGRYHLVALFDTNSSFAPLVEWLAEPDAGDYAGATTSAVEADGAEVQLSLERLIRFDRPGFTIPEGPAIADVVASRAMLETRAEPLLSVRAESNFFAVFPRSPDQTGDNLPELYPRVIMTRLEDGEDPRTAKDQVPLVIVPAFVDPMPFLTRLEIGPPLPVTDRLPILIPPFSLQGGALTPGIPAGRYRVTLISADGQTWRVPNASDLALGRAEGARDPANARFIEVEDAPRPAGRIQGEAVVPGVLAPNASVLIFAFSEAEPPPPSGAGRPASVTRLPASVLSSGRAPYELSGLATGSYVIRAFIDRDGNFVPWYETHEQPTRGDVPGGYFEEGLLAAVAVDEDGPPRTGVDVAFIEAGAHPHDRPLFSLPSDLVLDPAGEPLSVNLLSRSTDTPLLEASGVFPIRWVDLDLDQIADDVNGDSIPDVFPLVIAERLDESDPEALTLATPRERIFGVVPVAQFDELGFPTQDTTATSTVVESITVRVVFPPLSQKSTGEIGPPTPGEYRVTVINDRGQTWSVPNVMRRADLDPIQLESGRVLRVRAP